MKDSDSYSEHIGIRLRPCDMERLNKWAKLANLKPSVFTRALLLGKMDELEKERGK